MKWPFITRKEHEAKMAEFHERFLTIEQHFVTKRDETGKILETLADRRRKGTSPPKRVNMRQLCKWLENTDGGRKIGEQQRPS